MSKEEQGLRQLQQIETRIQAIHDRVHEIDLEKASLRQELSLLNKYVYLISERLEKLND